MSLPEKCTVCVVLRDRFSPTFRCLDDILKNTPDPYELLVVLGGAPSGLRRKLQEKYGHKARFIFEERFLNQAQYRNIALRETKTPLAVLMDNDVFVRPGWLTALIRCLRETNAGFVVPLILEEPNLIHAAGNDLLITHKDGKPYGMKVLRCAKIVYYEDSNLQRSRIPYGELHCQLLQVEPARKLEIFDERLHEQTEVDCGLLMAKGGYEMWFEPEAVVHFDLAVRITHAEDIRPFMFKWDIPAIIESMEYYKQKWGVDITEGGTWTDFSKYMNQKLGVWSRLFPCRASMAVDNAYHALGFPLVLWRKIKDRLVGSHRWKQQGSTQ
jgi:hypothetical protein